MKNLKWIFIVVILMSAGVIQAQFSVSVNFPAPPMWGPAGYTSVQFYYLPDVEAYYDVRSSMFIYFSGSTWVHRAYLPSRYRNYDLYGGYKVVMADYHGNAPYSHFKEHKMKYGKGYHGKPQRTIGKRPGSGHPDAKNSRNFPHENQGGNHDNSKNAGHGNDKGGSHGNDKGHGHDGGKGKK